MRLWWTAHQVLWKESDGSAAEDEALSEEEEESFFDTYAAVLAKVENPQGERRWARFVLEWGILEDLGVDRKRLALCKAAQVGVAENPRGFKARLHEVRTAGGTRTEIEALLDVLRPLIPVARGGHLAETRHTVRLERRANAAGVSSSSGSCRRARQT